MCVCVCACVCVCVQHINLSLQHYYSYFQVEIFHDILNKLKKSDSSLSDASQCDDCKVVLISAPHTSVSISLFTARIYKTSGTFAHQKHM